MHKRERAYIYTRVLYYISERQMLIHRNCRSGYPRHLHPVSGVGLDLLHSLGVDDADIRFDNFDKDLSEANTI